MTSTSTYVCLVDSVFLSFCDYFAHAFILSPSLQDSEWPGVSYRICAILLYKATMHQPTTDDNLALQRSWDDSQRISEVVSGDCCASIPSVLADIVDRSEDGVHLSLGGLPNSLLHGRAPDMSTSFKHGSYVFSDFGSTSSDFGEAAKALGTRRARRDAEGLGGSSELDTESNSSSESASLLPSSPGPRDDFGFPLAASWKMLSWRMRCGVGALELRTNAFPVALSPARKAHDHLESRCAWHGPRECAPIRPHVFISFHACHAAMDYGSWVHQWLVHFMQKHNAETEL